MLRLSGLSYYHRGYGHWYIGKVMEALEDLERADAALIPCIGADLDRGRVWLVKAMAVQAVGNFGEAFRLAEQAESIFVRFGDRDRIAASRTIVGTLLEDAQKPREALAIHSEVADMPGISERWRVSAFSNLGRCYQVVGELDRAIECLVEAIDGYERLGMLTFRSKTRWFLADVFAQQGKYPQALNLYLELRAEFEELGMLSDVALVSLDAAEVLVALGRASEIRKICSAAMDYFIANGLSRTEPALRGLSYLQEADIAGRMTPQMIRDVRAFILAPTSEAWQLFAQLPE